jgi:predicted  nucleic acid-binding Zn-ribbon protein
MNLKKQQIKVVSNNGYSRIYRNVEVTGVTVNGRYRAGVIKWLNSTYKVISYGEQGVWTLTLNQRWSKQSKLIIRD